MKFSAICLLGAIGLAAADKLPVRFGRQEQEDVALSGPYEPSGWQPDGPQLTLPNQEYGPPAQEYGPPPTEGTADVEVSKENIVFAGQSVALVDAAKVVSNQYLPPAAPEAVDRNQNPLTVQGLPFIQSTGQLNKGEYVAGRPFRLQQRPFAFNQQQKQQQQQQRLQQQPRQQRIVYRPVQTPLATQQRLTVPAPQASVSFHHKKPIKKPHFEAQRQQIIFSQRQEQEQDPATVYGPPQESQGIYPPPSAPEQQYGAPPPQQPEQQYGAPQQQPEPQAPEFQGAVEDNEEDAEDVSGPAISVANAVSNNGQYYILGEDNVLQRVVYMTARDQSTNGFSAKLKYEPVEPIRDPIYTYDQLGQLVRIYNK